MGYQDYSAAGGVFFQGLEDGGFVELTFVYVSSMHVKPGMSVHLTNGQFQPDHRKLCGRWRGGDQILGFTPLVSRLASLTLLSTYGLSW